MRNGSGDEYSITFTDGGAFLRGFAHGGVPSVTIALWRLAGDEHCHHGPLAYPPAWENEYADPDGSDWLFGQLDGRSESYLQYAREYFERQLPAEAVMAVIEHRPLTAALVRALPERSAHDLNGDLYRIGYPAE